MNANDVDVGDTVRVVRGDWANQIGIVTHKAELFPIPGEPQRALYNIRLMVFRRIIQKNNLDIEIVNETVVRGA